MVVNLLGSDAQRKNAERVGQAGQQAKEFEAKQYEQSAGQAKAAAQTNASEQKLQEDYVVSRAQALSAASGGGATDAGVVKLISDYRGRGAYQRSMLLYQGDEEARRFTMAAQAARNEGEVAKLGGNIAANAATIQGTSSLIQGGTSLYQKYSGKTPYQTTTSDTSTSSAYSDIASDVGL